MMGVLQALVVATAATAMTILFWSACIWWDGSPALRADADLGLAAFEATMQR